MADGVSFHDHKPRCLSLYEAVVTGLAQDPKVIPPKFFYDETGSQLFDAICAQPEYYLPDAERQVLLGNAGEIAALTGRARVIIEPGAGAALKIRWLLDALRPVAYVPMDISGDYLKAAAERLVADYPWLSVHAACVDFSHSLPIPDPVPDAPRLAFFPGSSLGNFEPLEAQRFLADLRVMVGVDGMLLIGVDTKKPAAVLDSAYNDAAGVTAAFNLNLLHRIRRELDADVDPGAFVHRAFYDPEAGRIEMHLVSREEQVVRVNGRSFAFEAGESLLTECSYKYAPSEFLDLASGAGFIPLRHWLAPGGMFGVYLLRGQ